MLYRTDVWLLIKNKLIIALHYFYMQLASLCSLLIKSPTWTFLLFPSPVSPTDTKHRRMYRLSKAVVYLSVCWVLNECMALVPSLLAVSVIPALPLTAVLITVISIFMVIAGLLLFVPVINLPSEQLIWQLNLFCHRAAHSHTRATLGFCLEVNRWSVCVEGMRKEGGKEYDWRDPYSGEKLPSSWAVGITDTLPAAASLAWLF